MTYKAPINDIRLTLEHVIGLDRLSRGFPDFNAELAAAVVEEAGRFANDVIAPLNAPGDRAGCSLANGAVTTPPGYADAYKRFAAAGWGGVAAPAEWGGQGLPKTLAGAAEEMWAGASMAFSLCALLTQGAIELLSAYGTPQQQQTYLPKLISALGPAR